MWQERWLPPSPQTQSPRDEKRMRGLKPPTKPQPWEGAFGTEVPRRKAGAGQRETGLPGVLKVRVAGGFAPGRVAVLPEVPEQPPFPAIAPPENRAHHISLTPSFLGFVLFYCLSLVQIELGEGKRKGKCPFWSRKSCSSSHTEAKSFPGLKWACVYVEFPWGPSPAQQSPLFPSPIPAAGEGSQG